MDGTDEEPSPFECERAHSRRLLARAPREGRSDDTEATIDHRLEVYDTETEPLLEFYARRRLMIEVDGEQPGYGGSWCSPH